MRIIQPINIEIYTASNGKSPFVEWLESLKDKTVRYRIKERLDRVSMGNFGDCKVIANELAELRFSFGSGYRVYFGQKDDKIILLLCGGDKRSQKQDVTKAKEYWEDYLSEKNYD